MSEQITLDQIQETTAMLLPCQLDPLIANHPDFAPACQDGLESYKDYQGVFTHDEVRAFVRSSLCRHYNLSEAVRGTASLPRRAGFVLGFLSGLAHEHWDLACFGLNLLHSLVLHQYREEVQRGCNPLVDVPGLVECR